MTIRSSPRVQDLCKLMQPALTILINHIGDLISKAKITIEVILGSSTTYEFSYLNNMPCNTEVTIQVITPTQPIRLRTRLIGVDPHRSIIFALGSDNSWQEARQFFRPGQSIVVRLVNSDEPDANILAFRSSIKKLLNNTESWLIIDYPKALQKVALRQNSRISINLKASIQVILNHLLQQPK